MAVESSLKKTTTTEEVFVTKLRKVSAGLLRERLFDIDKMKEVKVLRDAAGNVSSPGRMGEYHHLLLYQPQRFNTIGGDALDVVPNDSICNLSQSIRRLWLERRII